MAQAITHRSYNALLSSLVYSKLGIRNTSLPAGPRIAGPSMHGYALDPPHPPTDVTTLLGAGLSWASGGVNAQIIEKSPQPMLAAWRRLRHIEGDAVCAALR
jgi:hypothetical protein